MRVVKLIFTCYFVLESFGTGSDPGPSIIIIGSGPSGIAAATRLLKYNFTNIKVLEAEDRIGGRIHSVKFGDAYVDLGAEFCHGEKDNIVYSMVQDLGLLKPLEWKLFFLLSNGDSVKKETNEKIFAFTESLQASEEITSDCQNFSSVGDCFRIRSRNIIVSTHDPTERKIIAQSFDWTRAFLSAADSAFDLKDLNITTNYKDCEGEYGLRWKGVGYKTILEIMMNKYSNLENELPINDKIFLRKEVSKIDNWQTKQKVEVTTVDGSKYRADHVIFTPSVGVLKANHHTLFNPALPQEKIDAISSIGFGAVIKTFSYFSYRWWEDITAWSFMWTVKDKKILKEENLEWLVDVLGFNEAENNSNVLIAWYAGSYVPLIEELSLDEIIRGQEHLINTFLAHHYNVTRPDKIIRSSWFSNPHFRGTYSYDSVKAHSAGINDINNKLAKPLFNKNNQPSVLFAGEATHPYYFSTVHGAIETGYREAHRLINLYQN